MRKEYAAGISGVMGANLKCIKNRNGSAAENYVKNSKIQ